MYIVSGQNLISCKPKYLKLISRGLSPFTMQGKQVYSKFKVPIETGLQTMYNPISNMGVGQDYYTLSVIVRTSVLFISIF